MLQSLSATKKGLITGTAMVLTSLAIYFSLHSFDNPFQYLVFGMYTAGIVWTLLTAENSENKFSAYFSQGFKCFIIVTFMMVLFNWGFYKLHPEIIAQMVENGKKQMIAEGNYLPNQIEEAAQRSRDYALTMIVSANIFKYIILGALITAITAGFLIMKRKQ